MKNVHRYIIDYEYGSADLFIDANEDWKSKFFELANRCFGIRKSIGTVSLIGDPFPAVLAIGAAALYYSGGDLVIWDEEGKKILDEWDQGSISMIVNDKGVVFKGGNEDA